MSPGEVGFPPTFSSVVPVCLHKSDLCGQSQDCMVNRPQRSDQGMLSHQIRRRAHDAKAIDTAVPKPSGHDSWDDSVIAIPRPSLSAPRKGASGSQLTGSPLCQAGKEQEWNTSLDLSLIQKASNNPAMTHAACKHRPRISAPLLEFYPARSFRYSAF
ncbi:hypothetical protein SKAU_G00290290 [Synaphobranchus kaupii]|uniref:Uncharacterized protein n=1 Tax=Synaphobranchus kaupii TaxID=118154 RepID=A0A9Q1ETK7_SYNKA|nr:hypothetical protein SKAU_G00290290 [Synaphobranchus kaupii]